jgi:hypothetical protein
MVGTVRVAAGVVVVESVGRKEALKAAVREERWGRGTGLVVEEHTTTETVIVAPADSIEAVVPQIAES